jgi:hypothetical protein
MKTRKIFWDIIILGKITKTTTKKIQKMPPELD